MKRPTNRQRDDLAAAFHDFDTMYSLLIGAENELLGMEDIEGVPQHLARIAAVKTSVAGMKHSIADIGDLYAHALPLLGNILHFMPHATMYAVKGATAALSAMHYEASRFIRESRDGKPSPGAFAQLVEWGTLGAMTGIIGGTLENKGH